MPVRFKEHPFVTPYLMRSWRKKREDCDRSDPHCWLSYNKRELWPNLAFEPLDRPETVLSEFCHSKGPKTPPSSAPEPEWDKRKRDKWFQTVTTSAFKGDAGAREMRKKWHQRALEWKPKAEEHLKRPISPPKPWTEEMDEKAVELMYADDWYEIYEMVWDLNAIFEGLFEEECDEIVC